MGETIEEWLARQDEKTIKEFVKALPIAREDKKRVMRRVAWLKGIEWKREDYEEVGAEI
ncbi:MAG: hypothetical protein QW734_09060 [Candidatus Bathyarchaeia archaeon]